MMPQSRPDFAAAPQETARQLAAYIPVTLARLLLAGDAPQPGKPIGLKAAAMFADITGFTAMSEELAADGPRGAEEVNRVLLVTFTAMIDVIHQMGGAVSHFYGDAMSVYFPDEDGTAAARALACAHMMQRLMRTSLGRVVTNRPPGKVPFFDLTIKIGLGYGTCQALVVGDVDHGMEFVLTGMAVDEAALAEKQAASGEVTASRTILARAGLPAAAAFQAVPETALDVASCPLLAWTAVSDDQLRQLAAATTPFVPPALLQRLIHTGTAALAEHRPVTSLFVQFGFVGDDDTSSTIVTSAMGRQLQQYYQWASRLVRRFGQDNARVNRVLTGDKGNQLHIIFGAPVAPDAPEQALRCALAMVRERPEFVATQKIGLAAGKVFAGPVGAEQRREYTVVGDVVNLSARLMQAADANEVWTDITTADRARQSIEFQSLPPVTLKGKQMALTPQRAVTERSASAPLNAYLDRWNRPLFGRDQEVQQLHTQMQAALGGAGNTAALFGPTGAGKSRLLAYAVRHWLEQGGRGLLGVCQPHTSEIPYGPWRTIWADLFGLTAGMTLAEQVNAVQTRTATWVPESAKSAGLWAEPMGLPIPQHESLQPLTAEARQARFFTLVRRVLRAAARSQPLMIVLEGIHWADQSSLALLDELTRDMEEVPLFVALTFRPRDTIALASLERPSCTTLPVMDLSPVHARELLHHLVGAETLPAAVEQHLGLRDREGRDSPVNPLFLEEALNVMLAVGVLERNGRLQVNERLLAEMQLPDTIHGLLLARLDRLPPPARNLLQIASVIGRQFELDSLSALAPRTSRDLMMDLLSDLSNADMTRLVTADPEWVYLFQHAMTHEVAYESLPFARRQSLHAAVAGWIQDRYAENIRPLYPVLAFHFSRANLHEPGLAYALLAADDARAIFANREAVELYNLAETHLRALDDAARWETAVDLYLARGECMRLLGEFDGALQNVDASLALTRQQHDVERHAQGLNLKAELRYRQGRFEEAVTVARQVVADLAGRISPKELSRAYQWIGMASVFARDFETALDSLHKAEAICLNVNDESRLARVLEGLALAAYMQRDLDNALPALQRSVDLSRKFANPVNIASTLNNIALILFQLGRVSEALASVEEAIAIIRDTSSTNFLASFIGNKAEFLCYLGRYEEALGHLEKATELFQRMDDTHGLVEVHLLAGLNYFAPLGDVAEARRRFQEVDGLIGARTADFPEETARLRIGWGQVALAEDQPAQALAQLAQAQQIIEADELLWWKPPLFLELGRAHKANGAREAAAVAFRASVTAVADDGCPDYLGPVYLELAQVEADSAKREAYLRQCVQAVQQRARKIDRDRCLQEAARLLDSEVG